MPFCFLTLLLAACGSPEPAQRRVVVLGFDGMDPVLAERWMKEGKLPNFQALRERGGFAALGTSNPPQSPVAWASFATGLDAGGHGIFDFLHRDTENYRPDFSIAGTTPIDGTIDLFGWSIPTGGGELYSKRDGEAFWSVAESRGQRASVLRVPVTYPPDPVTRMLSGMGVPDLLGSQGTYTLYSARRVAGADSGGRVVLVRVRDGGRIETELEGPAHPMKPDAPALSVPLLIEARDGGALITLDDVEVELDVGAWSDWVPVEFGFATVLGAPGMVRMHLAEGFPLPRLYVTPIQPDPLDPVVPISAPPSFAPHLAERIGRYHTLGMPEETWSMNQGHLDEAAWLDTVRATLAEGEAMLYDTLAANDTELVIKVFVQTDRVSHMFWRGLDPEHPLYPESSERARGAIEWIYTEADRVLGETVSRLGPEDDLIVLSDHGFSSFRRAVHLNRWLADQGYLVLKPGAVSSEPLFASVDLSKTRAYALGLNGLFVNIRGREAQGIVEPADVEALKAELTDKLLLARDPEDGAALVRRVFEAGEIYHGDHRHQAPDLVVGYAAGYRASWQTSLGGVPVTLAEDNLQPWSGDHCVDPELVPGVLFTSFPIEGHSDGIQQMSKLISGRLDR